MSARKDDASRTDHSHFPTLETKVQHKIKSQSRSEDAQRNQPAGKVAIWEQNYWLWTACTLIAVIAAVAVVLFKPQLTSLRANLPFAPILEARDDALLQGSASSTTFERRGPANGVFPRGCKWRDVQKEGREESFWADQTYEYWQDRTSSWSREQPQECRLTGISNPSRNDWPDGSPHSQVWCDDYSCLYQNLWYNNGKWILLVGDGKDPIDWWSMTRNVDLQVMHVTNTTEVVKQLNHTIVPGSTLVLDFPFFQHPTAIGHWGEVMYPLYSIFKNETHFKVPPDQFVLLHLKRIHLMEWARAIMAAILGLQKDEPLPQILLQKEQSDVLHQVEQALEGTASNEWVCFEKALVVNDLPSGGIQSFLSREDAHRFRDLVYANHGLEPAKWRIPPRVITFQRKKANRRVVNEGALLKLLSTYGEVQVVEFTSSTPFKKQLEVIASTGVFISIHTSNLANAHFLQPGSAVFEIIQRNWFWADMDLTFKMQTKAMGDIHHYAWRARHRNETVYLNNWDEARYGHWTEDLCNSGECVEAQTNVDVIVNLEQFRELLDSRLPLVFQGASVEDAELAWPGRGSDIPSPFPEGLS